MDKVVQAAEGASAVLRDVLVFTRWAENDEKSCQIEDALRSTLPLARVAAPSTVHVRDNIDPTPGTVDVSFTDLQTIVLNFTSNGTAAIGANVGEIIVGLRTEILTSALTLGVMELKPGNYAVLSVSDSEQPPRSAPIPLLVHDRFFVHRNDGFRCRRSVSQG